MIQMRPATAHDAPSLARVHVAAIRGLNAQFYTPEQIAAWSSDKEPLLDALESEARSRGETSLRLDSSLGAVAFYVAHGYVEWLECVPSNSSKSKNSIDHRSVYHYECPAKK